MKRRSYAAPSAELVCLAPSAPVASWKWSGGSGNSKWNSNTNHWFGAGLDPSKLAGSVIGIAEWIDDEGVIHELD